MRAILFVAILAAAALAGCAGNSQPTPSVNHPVGPSVRDLPANFTDSRNVVGGADPLNQAPGAPCESPASSCVRYPVTVNATAGNVTMNVHLSWTVQANDFDLYLYKDGNQIDVSGAAPPGTSEQLRSTLRAGTYEVVVDPYGVAQDTFTLEVTFTPSGR